MSRIVRGKNYEDRKVGCRGRIANRLPSRERGGREGCGEKLRTERGMRKEAARKMRERHLLARRGKQREVLKEARTAKKKKLELRRAGRPQNASCAIFPFESKIHTRLCRWGIRRVLPSIEEGVVRMSWGKGEPIMG